MNPAVRFLLNPFNWFRAWQFKRRQTQFDKSAYDLELYLYSRILKNDMLHYGYFDDPGIDPESIALKDLEEAQLQYAEKICSLMADKDAPVLDIGCGMGGLSALLRNKGFRVEALTPNANQVQHLRNKYPDIPCHPLKWENFSTGNQYGTLINAESLQYIPLDPAFQKAGEQLAPGGRWIIADYFRISKDTAHHSGQVLPDFLEKIREYSWSIVLQEDMTEHILPTLKAVQIYVDRFLLPLKHFGEEKLRYKKAWLYFLTGPLRQQAEQKMNRELKSVNPELFAAEKRYMLFVLEKCR